MHIKSKGLGSKTDLLLILLNSSEFCIKVDFHSTHTQLYLITLYTV